MHNIDKYIMEYLIYFIFQQYKWEQGFPYRYYTMKFSDRVSLHSPANSDLKSGSISGSPSFAQVYYESNVQ